MRRELLPAEPLEPDALIGLAELCTMCGVNAELVMDLVAEGIVESTHRGGRGPFFSGVSVRRVQVVRRLQRDLGINHAGAGLAIDLLEELRDLRHRVRLLERQLSGSGSF